MANPEHLTILKQGVEVWNRWRYDHPSEQMVFSLTQADLRQTDLRGASLRRVDLRGVLLVGTDLSGADLAEAHLRETDLRGVILNQAVLNRADLRQANLNGVPLTAAELSGAHLTEATLSGSDLSGANLRKATLSRVNLSWANCVAARFTGATMSGANLVDGDFREADLSGADLSGANLEHANLHQANLHQANLSSASLDGANFAGTYLGGTIFGDINLSGVAHLDKATHGGPSILGIETLYRSGGQIPQVFLRGVGLPDSYIEYYRSLAIKPIEFYSCFISYSTKDQHFGSRIYSDLQSNGVRCWFAPHDIQGGKKVHEQIDQAIRVYDRLLLILSEHSMSSEWVGTEIANARQREVREKRQMLFPISLMPFEKIKEWKAFDADTGKDSAREVREYFIPDFSDWKDQHSYQEAFQRLLRDLKAQK